MESAKAPLKYTIQTKVTRVWEHWAVISVSKDGIELKENRGWFVSFLGSYESLGLGPDKPELTVGDDVNIIIERAKCPPSLTIKATNTPSSSS